MTVYSTRLTASEDAPSPSEINILDRQYVEREIVSQILQKPERYAVARVFLQPSMLSSPDLKRIVSTFEAHWNEFVADPDGAGQPLIPVEGLPDPEDYPPANRHGLTYLLQFLLYHNIRDFAFGLVSQVRDLKGGALTDQLTVIRNWDVEASVAIEQVRDQLYEMGYESQAATLHKLLISTAQKNEDLRRALHVEQIVTCLDTFFEIDPRRLHPYLEHLQQLVGKIHTSKKHSPNR